MCFLTNVSACKEVATVSRILASEKKNLKFEWVSLQPEQLIFTAKKLAVIAHKLLHRTTKHCVQLLGAELLNKTLLFTLLFIPFSFRTEKKSNSYVKTAVLRLLQKLITESHTPDFTVNLLLFNLSSWTAVHSATAL